MENISNNMDLKLDQIKFQTFQCNFGTGAGGGAPNHWKIYFWIITNTG